MKEGGTNEWVFQWGPGAGPAHRDCPGQLGTSCREDLSLPPRPLCLLRTPAVIFEALVDRAQGELSGFQGSLNLPQSRSLALTRTYHLSEAGLMDAQSLERPRSKVSEPWKSFSSKSQAKYGVPGPLRPDTPRPDTPPQHTRLSQAYVHP